jgi:hypothetical protein
VYSTYLGGAEDDEARQILVDVLGNIYIAGNTSSANFPTTGSAVQRTFGGAVDAFVAKLNPAGSQLIYSTYLGGTGDDVLLGFDLDNALTGGGGYDNASRLQSGVPTPPDPLNRITLNASATIGGQSADILFLGLTPGLIGVVQANVRLPPVAAGNHPLTLTIGGVASNGPLVSVQ